MPTVRDRCVQALVKAALEPQWEARFEPNSYGFRPGRSCHDAIESLFQHLCRKSQYALDADIKKCFDRIDQQALLRKLDPIPILHRLIKQWLQAGIMDGLELSHPDKGTPQGGVISPLLANIALHGMEAVVHQVRKGKGGPHLVRYADDFVILHEERKVIEECQEAVSRFLAEMGLELKPEKTKLTHTLHACEGQVGFDFLGFTIRQHPVGKHHSGVSQKGTLLGFKTLITPSRAKVKRHLDALGEVIHRMATHPQEELTGALNAKIQGWTHYYRTVVSSQVFSHADNQVHAKLWRWAQRRHPRKGGHWRKRRYWSRRGNAAWVFGNERSYLLRHDQTKIVRHIKVRGDKSPYDGDWPYWAARRGHYPGVGIVTAWLLQAQKGQCAVCGHYFLTGDDLIERHHKDKDRTNQKRSNLVLLHRHCHDGEHGRQANGPTGPFP